jgi:hypothetical protein
MNVSPIISWLSQESRLALPRQSLQYRVGKVRQL